MHNGHCYDRAQYRKIVCYLLWNDFMCILLYMIMCMLLSATSTHFKWELMLYCLLCPTLNKVFLLLLLLYSYSYTKCSWFWILVGFMVHYRRWHGCYRRICIYKCLPYNPKEYWVESILAYPQYAHGSQTLFNVLWAVCKFLRLYYTYFSNDDQN